MKHRLTCIDEDLYALNPDQFLDHVATHGPVGSTHHRMRFLALRLWKFKNAYYNGDQPLVSDAVYDYMERELKNLEQANPSLVTYNSPITAVGTRPRT